MDTIAGAASVAPAFPSPKEIDIGALGDAFANIDSGWAVLAIAIVGLYIIMWKYGGEILRLVREMHQEIDEVVETQDPPDIEEH